MSVVQKYAADNGSVVIWTLDVQNSGSVPCVDAKVVITVPTGLSITGPTESGYAEITVPQGSFDKTTDTWYVGTLAVGATLSLPLEFTVDDKTQVDPVSGYFTVSATISSVCNDPTDDNNTSELVISIGPECEDGALSIGSGTESNVDLSIG